MTYDVISTGSQGNAIFIGGKILVDCGVSYTALNDVRDKIKLVLLTHIHGDHFKSTTIRRLAVERPKIRFGCGEWLVEKLLVCGVEYERIDVLQKGKCYDYKEFKISPVKLYHDVPNFGYRIFMNGEKVFYATDTAHLDGIEAKDYDLYMVEANYEDEEIQERIKAKRERGEYAYEYGVIRSHLSKRQCDNFIYENIGDKGRYVYLHQHQERNAKDSV